MVVSPSPAPRMPAAKQAQVNHDSWWISLKHGGLLIAPSKLEEFFIPRQLEPLSRYVEDKLRRDVTRVQDGDESQLGTLLNTVLEEVLGLSQDFWQKGSSVERDWARQAITREQIKPRRVWQDDRGAVLPVFVADTQDTGGKVARLGIGRGRRAVSRVIEWLRKADQKVALLTNGLQWRLIHAGADYDAWCEWDINLWFEEGRPGAQVTALRLLLGEASLRPEQAGVPSPLIAAIQASRQGQAELSDVLGERVRQAVELLIRESSVALDEILPGSRELGIGSSATAEVPTPYSPLPIPPSNRDIYIAASRIIMRCVVILFAEARDLLPRENPIYHSSYGIQGLREQLDRMAGGRASERLRNSFSAWPRLLALFRLVYEGSPHEALPVPRYGGGLFTPGTADATDPILRSLAALENPAHAPADVAVYRILELLCRSKVKVRQGRRSTWVEAPVDFSDLSSEYIGILYEGLLDFELRRAEPSDPMIFLNLGDQPALPLTRLEGMDDKALESLVEKLKTRESGSESGESGEEDDEDGGEELEEQEWESGVENRESEEDEDDNSDPTDDSLLLADDLIQDLRDRAQTWAVRAVLAGKLVSKPKSKKADKLAEYEQQVGKMAQRLIARIILPGEWFLVRWGGTRKGSGTFYTRPQLAVPTVQRTLEPLVYEVAEGNSEGVGSRESGVGDGRTVLSRPDSLAAGDDSGREVLPRNPNLSQGGDLWTDLADSTSGNLDTREHRGGLRTGESRGVHPIPANRSGLPQRTGDPLADRGESQNRSNDDRPSNFETVRDRRQNAQSPDPLLTTEKIGGRALGVGSRDQEHPHSPLPTPHSRRPKPPATILALRVCDPACGSASFLIAALRYLTNALWESLFYHGWLIETDGQIREGIPKDAQPEWFVECVKDLPLTVGDPTASTMENAETYAKPRLKRYVVERCISGVDINPLAVELARVSLWVETMDRELRFTFLDHKIKAGNSLVGCWFDQFQDYPIMAWEREAGDANHKGVNFAAKVWTKEIKRLRNDIVKDELRELLAGGVQLSMFEDRLLQPPEQTHDELQAAVEEIHTSVLNPEQQEDVYERSVKQKQALKQLKWAFDCWCAVWFWQGNDLEVCPTPMQFVNPKPEVRAAVERVARDYQFFHWELEFPDVFCTPVVREGNREWGVGNRVQEHPHSPLPTPYSPQEPHSPKAPGFDAIVGNPPWETLQPNSKEFFSNVDPLYRTYGKQEALAYQRQYFEVDRQIEEDWMAYCANFKAWANWNKYVAYAFGDNEAAGSKFSLSRKKAEAEQLATDWRRQRANHKGYSDPEHPYRYQGEGKPYTYKMFLELTHALTREGGRFGLIIPSGIYTDKGSGSLRRLFLNRCEWTHLYAFQNERFVFSNIHHSFKMVIISVNKGGRTESVATRFRLGPGDSPEAQELMTDVLDDARFLSVPAEQIKRFSPNTGALLEIRSERDLKILEKMYANGVLLGDDGPDGWGVQYRQGDFNMTSDSKLFPPRPKWEAQGYQPDEYGHWLKGNWQPYDGSGELGIGSKEGNWELGVGSRDKVSPHSPLPTPHSPLSRPEGLVLSADGTQAIHTDDVEDVALPLYQGIMIHQFDFSRKGWVSGTGLRAIWRDIPFEAKCLEPQFLIGIENYSENSKNSRGLRVSFRDIARSTDERTFISSLLPDLPCGNKVPILSTTNPAHRNLELCPLVNSFAFDFALRSRLGGTSLNYFIVAELPLAKKIHQSLQIGAAQINFVTPKFALEWLKLQPYTKPNMRWQQLWAISPYERLRLRCILDAVVAELYGLDYTDFARILEDCDHPSKLVSDSTFARTLEPKGFWRVDKEKDPELRHTVLSLIAFHDLKRLGLDAFLNLNHGEGWMLPDTLRLADYGLGYGDRAKEPQPVAARIGAETAKLWEEGNRELGIGSRAEAATDSPLPTPHSPKALDTLPTTHHYQYRYLPWQLQSTPAESWAECERHAENLRRLLGTPASSVGEDAHAGSHLPTPDSYSQTADGQLTLIPPDEEQLSLF